MDELDEIDELDELDEMDQVRAEQVIRLCVGASLSAGTHSIPDCSET